jgi:hypothetical protein
MAGRRLTLWIEDEIVQRARVLAAKRGLSLSGLVAEQIERLMNQEYEAARRQAHRFMDDATGRGRPEWRRATLYER